jgi:propanediol dehydratase small subunit
MQRHEHRKEIASMLRIEAQQYRQAGRSNAAQALERAAECLKLVSRDTCPAIAFDWPRRSISKSALKEPT